MLIQSAALGFNALMDDKLSEVRNAFEITQGDNLRKR